MAIFCNIVNVLIVTFVQYNASLLNKSSQYRVFYHSFHKNIKQQKQFSTWIIMRDVYFAQNQC